MKSAQTAGMVRFGRHKLETLAASQQRPDTVCDMMIGEPFTMAAVPVAAAWPAGASQLAIAIDVCQRSNDVEVHRDWVVAARN